MTDYREELVPPQYRNLVINPGGESQILATWFASNGSVDTGATEVTPVSGTGVTKYTVTDATAKPYFFSPFGPAGAVHRNAFKIPYGRTISARTWLRSSLTVWVELKANFSVWDGAQLVSLGTVPISPSVETSVDPLDTAAYVDPLDSRVLITGTATGEPDPAAPNVFVTLPAAGSPDPALPKVFVSINEGGDPTVRDLVTSDGNIDPADPTVFNATVPLDPNDNKVAVFPGDTANDATGDVYVSAADDGDLDTTDPDVFVTGTPVETTDADVVILETNATFDPTSMTHSVMLTGGAAWVEFLGFAESVDIPDGATHWSLEISVAGSDPSGALASPPPVDAGVYADQTFVTDSGFTLDGVTYVDGSTAGAYWEGEPYYSSSRTGTAPVVPPVVVEPDTGGEPDGTGEPDGGTGPSVPADPPPLQPVYVRPRTTVEVAEDILAWRNTPEHLCLKSDFQIANLRLNSIDEEGVLWILSDVEGWWTLPEPDVPDIPRGWFDGSYETRGRYTARVFTVNGSFIPRDKAGVPAARGRLTRAINLCHRGDYFMTHEDATAARTDTKGSKVWLSGQPLITTVNANGRTDFSIGLRAPDPIKYRFKNGVPPGHERVVVTTSNRIDFPERTYPRVHNWAFPEAIFGITVANAINYGDTIVWPTLTLKGPTRGPVNIINSDTEQVMRIVRKLNVGEELVINCFTKEVTLNGFGNYRFYLDIDVDWLQIQPGPNRLFFEEDIYGPQRTELEVLWRSGWIG